MVWRRILNSTVATLRAFPGNRATKYPALSSCPDSVGGGDENVWGWNVGCLLRALIFRSILKIWRAAPARQDG